MGDSGIPFNGNNWRLGLKGLSEHVFWRSSVCLLLQRDGELIRFHSIEGVASRDFLSHDHGVSKEIAHAKVEPYQPESGGTQIFLYLAPGTDMGNFVGMQLKAFVVSDPMENPVNHS